MATFGKTDIGGSSQTVAKDNKFFTKFQISEAGITTKITVYLDNSSGSDAVAKAGIYTDDNGSPNLLLVNSSEVTVADGLTDWVDFTLASTNLSATTDYWIAVIIGDQTLSYYYDAGSVDQSASDTDTYSDGFESEILLWLDSFTRSNSNALGLSWEEVENEITVTTIASNALKIKSRTSGGVPGRAFAYFDKTHDTDIQFSKLIFKSETNGMGGPSIRVDPDGSSASTTLYQAAYDGANDKIDLYKYVSERLIIDGTVLDTYNVTLNDGDEVWLEGDGTSLITKVNGSNVISYTDSTSPIVTGNVGISSRAFTGSGEIATTWDNWAGGDIHTLWDREISMYVTYTAGAMATGNMGLTIVGAGR